MNLVRLQNWPILKQLRLEEALLRHDARNWCVVNALQHEPTVVLGINGKVKELVNEQLVKRDSVPLVRRFTGGGTVVVGTGTVVATIIANKSDMPCKPFAPSIMEWTGGLYSKVFRRLGTKLAYRENDYVVDDLKVGGNAQAIIKDRWLHHTSFLWDFNDDHMAYLSMPQKRPQYRGDRDHTAFITRLNEWIPADFDTLLAKELATELTTVLPVTLATPAQAADVTDKLGGDNWPGNRSFTL